MENCLGIVIILDKNYTFRVIFPLDSQLRTMTVAQSTVNVMNISKLRHCEVLLYWILFSGNDSFLEFCKIH